MQKLNRYKNLCKVNVKKYLSFINSYVKKEKLLENLLTLRLIGLLNRVRTAKSRRKRHQAPEMFKKMSLW